MNRLLLMRHGKSDWSVGTDDFSRPLSDRGKRDVRRIGEYLGKSGLVPDLVISSPAMRAIDTAERCIRAAGAAVEDIVRDERIYLASPASLRTVLADYRDRADSIMLVGHNPGLDILLTQLIDDDLPLTSSGKLMTTANIAVIDAKAGTLERLIRPSELDED